MPEPAPSSVDRPDLSVVIPTFRRPVELGEAIASVLAQEGARVEIIVVDDCEHGSAELAVSAFRHAPVTYRRNPVPSRGRPALVRNFGATLATGELIHFLDDDDRVPAGHYAAVRQAFAASPRLDVVFGRVVPFGQDASAVAAETEYFETAARRARLYGRLGGRWAFSAALFFRSTLLVCGAAILRRRRLAELGGFDASLPLMEDVDFYARAMRRYGARFLDRPALHYRIGPSLMHQPQAQSGLIRDAYRRMHDRYRGEHGSLDFLLLKSVSRALRA